MKTFIKLLGGYIGMLCGMAGLLIEICYDIYYTQNISVLWLMVAAATCGASSAIVRMAYREKLLEELAAEKRRYLRKKRWERERRGHIA